VPDTNFHSLRHAFTTHCAEGDIPIDAVSATLGHTDRRTTERFYNHARFVAGSRAVARAMDTMMADLVADHETDAFGLRQSEKPAKPYGDGLSHVVEVRRLELLTPYMRKADEEEDDPPQASDDGRIAEDDPGSGSPNRPHESRRVR
jgi:hypothetical protein